MRGAAETQAGGGERRGLPARRAWAALAGKAGLPGWGSMETVGALLAFALIVLLSERLDLLWTAMPWPLAGLAVLASALLVRRIPAAVAVLWLLGLLSYAWTLAPGNTLLASLWGLGVVAAAAAGRWAAGFLIVLTGVFLNQLQNALALNAFGLQAYLSGSVHYRLGAIALVLLPVALAAVARERRRWLLPVWLLTATVAAFGALISGSRGVYLPLAVVVAALVARTGRQRRGLWRVLLAIAVIAVAIVLADRAVPYHPVAAALGAKASVSAQVSAVGTAGNFTQRLRYWDQGLAMALQRPLGVGLGGFRSTIHAFQRFPMVWSSSPHNVFVETVATLGWPGLVCLAFLLLSAAARAWRSARWPWALALVGIWFTLSVDVTADYPSMMVVAFGAIGACYGTAPSTLPRLRRRASEALAALAVLAGAAVAVWWFAPCSGPQCALTHWRGVPYLATSTVTALPEGDRGAFLAGLERLYPRSLWVLQLEERYAPSSEERLALAKRIALRYPLESWRNYLTWADLSLQAGDVAQAKEAVRRGLAVFGPDSRRFPEMRADPAGFRAWLARAHAILAMRP